VEKRPAELEMKTKSLDLSHDVAANAVLSQVPMVN